MLILSLVLLIGSAGGANLEESLDLEGLECAAQEHTDGMDIHTGTGLNDGLRKIINTGNSLVGGILRKALRSGVLLLVVVLLCALLDGTYAGAGEEYIQVIPLVGALAVAVISVSDMNSLIGLGREAIDNISLFSKALLPTMATVTAVSGAPAGAAARQLAAVLFSDVLFTLIDRLLIPLVYVYVAAFTAYAAVGNEGLKRMAGALKWAVSFILSVVMLGFVG